MATPADWMRAALQGGMPHDMAVSDALQSALAGLPLAQQVSEAHQLLQRRDQKFVLPSSALPALLTRLASTHALLASDAQRLPWYVTVYFDSAEQSLLRDHLRGKRPRHKVRVRHYLDRRLSFLEIKSKAANSQTNKARLPLAFGTTVLEPDAAHWLQQQLQPAGGVAASLLLQPQAWTVYQRITLLHLSQPERLTLDVNLRLGTAQGAQALHDSVIVELKRARRPNTVLSMDTARWLTEQGARPASLSKYVAAMMTSPRLPMAHFKAALGRFANKKYWEQHTP